MIKEQLNLKIYYLAAAINQLLKFIAAAKYNFIK
jgi:hypothetical protein